MKEQPQEPGLYWVRVGNAWYIADFHAAPSPWGGHSLAAWHRREDGMMYMTRFIISFIDEWGDRIPEPV